MFTLVALTLHKLFAKVVERITREWKNYLRVPKYLRGSEGTLYYHYHGIDTVCLQHH